MVRTCIPKPKIIREEDVEAAIQDIRENKISIRIAALKYNITKTLLGRRLLHGPLTVRRGHKTALTAHGEHLLADNLRIMAKWGFALSRAQVKDIVKEFVALNNIATPFKDGRPSDEFYLDHNNRITVLS